MFTVISNMINQIKKRITDDNHHELFFLFILCVGKYCLCVKEEKEAYTCSVVIEKKEKEEKHR